MIDHQLASSVDYMRKHRIRGNLCDNDTAGDLNQDAGCLIPFRDRPGMRPRAPGLVGHMRMVAGWGSGRTAPACCETLERRSAMILLTRKCLGQDQDLEISTSNSR